MKIYSFIALFALSCYITQPLFSFIQSQHKHAQKEVKTMSCCHSKEEKSKDNSKKESKGCCGDTDACDIFSNCCCAVVFIQTSSSPLKIYESFSVSYLQLIQNNIMDYNSSCFHPPEMSC
jgi:hypothetical protein